MGHTVVIMSEEWNEDKYKLMDKYDKHIDRLERNLAKLKAEAEELQNELEVEHFLEEGPGGKDPN